MLRVRLEHVPPFGGTSELLGIMEIVNDGSGTEDSGNYDVVLRGVGGGRPQREGRVGGFLLRNRYGPPWELVYQALHSLTGRPPR